VRSRPVASECRNMCAPVGTSVNPPLFSTRATMPAISDVERSGVNGAWAIAISLLNEETASAGERGNPLVLTVSWSKPRN
jgi:hypothetical protein